MKLVISFVEQYVGDSLALGFKFVNRKPVSFERLELWLKNLPDRVVGDAGPIAADIIGQAGMEGIGGFELSSFHAGFERDRGVHVAHVLHGCTQVVAAQLGLKCIVGHRFFTHLLQCAVDPFRRVTSCERISGKRYLEEIEPFGICLLPDVGSQ